MLTSEELKHWFNECGQGILRGLANLSYPSQVIVLITSTNKIRSDEPFLKLETTCS